MKSKKQFTISVYDGYIEILTNDANTIDLLIENEEYLDSLFPLSTSEYKFSFSRSLLLNPSFEWLNNILITNGKEEIIEETKKNNEIIQQVNILSSKANDIEYFTNLPDWDNFVESILSKMKNISVNGDFSDITIKQLIRVYIYSKMKNFANFSEPGTGKTITSLMSFFDKENQLGENLRLIIIAPISAIQVWKDEIINFTNIKEEEIHVYRKDYKENINKFFYDTSNSKVIIVNYESARNLYTNKSSETTWNPNNENNFIVYDEVHRVKGKGKYFDDSFDISKWGTFRLVLTGTPYSKEINEIKNIFNLNWSGSLPTISESEFDEFNNLINVNSADEEQIERVKSLLDPYYFKLSKKIDFDIEDAIDEFDKPINVNATKEQLLIDSYIQKKINKISVMIQNAKEHKEKEKLIEHLRKWYSYAQINSVAPNILYDNKLSFLNDIENLNVKKKIEFKDMPKIKESIKYIESIVNSGDKIIVWMRYKSNIENMNQLLNERKINSVYIHGEVKLSERIKILEDFNNNNNEMPMVLITNPDTLGESISLHKHIHNSLFIERGFSYYQWAQAKDRIHRVGMPKGTVAKHSYVKSKELWIDNKLFENLKNKLKIDQKIFSSLLVNENILKSEIDDDFSNIDSGNNELIYSQYNLSVEDLGKESFDNYDEFLMK